MSIMTMQVPQSKGPHGAGLSDTTRVCNHLVCSGLLRGLQPDAQYRAGTPPLYHKLKVVGQRGHAKRVQYAGANLEQIGCVNDALIVDAFSVCILAIEHQKQALE